MRRAVLDFALYRDTDLETNKEHHLLWADAAGWLFFDGKEPADAKGRYSFVHICNILDVSPAAIREKALTLTRDDIKRFNAHAGDS